MWWYWPLARRSFRTASITRAAACRRTAIAACANRTSSAVRRRAPAAGGGGTETPAAFAASTRTSLTPETVSHSVATGWPRASWTVHGAPTASSPDRSCARSECDAVPSARRIPPAATTTTESRTAEASASALAPIASPRARQSAPPRGSRSDRDQSTSATPRESRGTRRDVSAARSNGVSPPNCTSSSTRAPARGTARWTRLTDRSSLGSSAATAATRRYGGDASPSPSPSSSSASSSASAAAAARFAASARRRRAGFTAAGGGL